MLQKILLALLVLLPLSPTIAQSQLVCGQPTGQAAPQISFKWGDPDQNAKMFNDGILNYLNMTGSTDGLETAITAVQGADSPVITAQIMQNDLTGDQIPDVLSNVNLGFGATFEEFLSLFSCTEDGFQLVSTLYYGDWGDINPPTVILNITDLNDNQRPDILLYSNVILGNKGGSGISIYEWNGSALEKTFEYGPDVGITDQVQIANNDGDPATLELIFNNYYGYGQFGAGAYIEITRWRPIASVYHWNGSTYEQECSYFTDQTTTLYETLHSAEAYRNCRDYQNAQADYEAIWSDPSLEIWANVTYGSVPIMLPKSVSDPIAYVGDLERAYLRAFAGYRMTQIAIAENRPEDAQMWVEELQKAFPLHTNGYVYAAMAATLWENYQKESQISEACTAAEATFIKTLAAHDDPGISYYPKDSPGEIVYDFYYDSGVRYSSNPDNIFDVPDELSDMIQIPICL